jgi:putative membrane protein
MENTPATAPEAAPANASPAAVPEAHYRTLGRKTLWIFALERMHAAGIFLFLAVALLVVGGEPSLTKTPLGNLAHFALLGAGLSAILFVVIFGITFLIAWLIYTNYRFALGENSLKIKRGVIGKEEMAIPYRQIQDVDINRDLSFRIWGLSKLIILTAGREDAAVGGRSGRSDESEGYLPALDKDLAEWLQHELLTRANVQRVVEEREGE